MAKALDIPVIDLFAGPGGLGEGFARFRPRKLCGSAQPFRIALSIEKDAYAHRTLRLRAFVRQFERHRIPSAYFDFIRGSSSLDDLWKAHPKQAETAECEAWHAELGSTEISNLAVRKRIQSRLGNAKAWVLLGGPPCQAYSIAGRSRNRGIDGYSLESDGRHRLYEHYLRIVAVHQPPLFVMENVKGLLSTTVSDQRLFERICGDLEDPGRATGRRGCQKYRLVPLGAAEGGNASALGRFIVKAEDHGVPQRRHRLIVLGVRADLGGINIDPLERQPEVPCRQVLEGLPRLRSGLSDTDDSPDAWIAALEGVGQRRWAHGNASVAKRAVVAGKIRSSASSLRRPRADRGSEFVEGAVTCDYKPRWFLHPKLEGACNHRTRLHMESDLHRYLFVSCFGAVNGWSPKLREFPRDLLPDHANVNASLNGGLFNDRFWVSRRHGRVHRFGPRSHLPARPHPSQHVHRCLSSRSGGVVGRDHAVCRHGHE